MATDDAGRLGKLLSFRRNEEERVRLREARALSRVEAARRRARALEMQLSACQACPPGGPDSAGLIDAHRCACRLRDALTSQLRVLAQAEADLAEVRAEVAEAGRRRLAVERRADAAVLEQRRRVEAAGQSDIDESGRLRALMEES